MWGDLRYDIVLPSMGVIAMCAGNAALRRPPYAGIWKHIAAVGVFYPLGVFVDNYVYTKQKAKELMIYDYMARHPELFPEEKKVTYGEMMKPWHPMR